MNDPASDPLRAEHRRQWTCAALGDPATALDRASVDAGFRSYWRATSARGSHIVMDSPPGLEDVRPWLRMHDLLEPNGVRVPQVLARDEDNGFLLLEDLGGPTLARHIDNDNADAWFDAAFAQLIRLQSIDRDDRPAAVQPGQRRRRSPGCQRTGRGLPVGTGPNLQHHRLAGHGRCTGRGPARCAWLHGR